MILKPYSVSPYATVVESPVRSNKLLSGGYVNNPIMADFKRWGLRAIPFKPTTFDELIKVMPDLFNLESLAEF